MELSLTGSQINLATRLKQNTPAILYPRPSSVDLTRPRTPLKVNLKQQLKKGASKSSSNILQLLLSERIGRQENEDTGQPTSPQLSMADETVTDEECPEEIETIETDREELQPETASTSRKQTFKQELKPSQKPDLPGRVSFSANVFEIDFSDMSDDSRVAERTQASRKSRENTPKAVHFEREMSQQSKDDPSKKIIEDYKREIESLNRRHEEEIQKLNSCEQGNHFFNLNSDAVDSPDKSVVENYLETIKESNSLEIFEQLEAVTTIEDAEEDDNRSDSTVRLEKIAKNTWDNGQGSAKRSPSSIKSQSPSQSDKEETRKIIEMESRKPMPTRKKELGPRAEFNVKKLPLLKSTARNSPMQRNSRFSPVKPQPQIPEQQKLRKAKSVSSLKEETKLQEFQIDKVDSWMSMNQEAVQGHDSMRTLLLMKRPRSGNALQYNKEWRDTPSSVSKTDDEGNFSLEEANDCFSNESTTYDELVSIIKEIEADKRKTDERNSLKADVEFKLQTGMPGDGALLKDNAPTSDPVKKILNFLDDVESNCDRTIQRVHGLDSERDDFQFAIEEPDIVGSAPKMEDLLMLPSRHLARRVIAMYLRTNELSNAVQLAKENMKCVREEKLKAVRNEKAHTQKALSDQKKHFENIVARHQNFVEQLLKDKASLCEKVTALTRRVESQNQAWEHKLETEVNRTREAALASEKIRRERWTKENTKKIKELTVRGMEAEINRIMEKHKQELADLKREHQEEIHVRLDECRAKFESLREAQTEDREAIIEKERNAIRERYERQLIAEQHSFEEQKVRMTLEFNSERERLMAEVKVKEKEYEARKEVMALDKNQLIEQMRKDFKEKSAFQKEQHEAEIIAIRDQFEKDFAIWKSEFESAQKLREIERENAIRNECRKERDVQIDSIVAKIDLEAHQHQQEYDLKLRRMKDKFEIDLKEIELAENKAREKYLDTRHRLAECEGCMQNMQTTIKQLEIELGHSKRKCDEFLLEKDTIHERVRAEINTEMEAKRKEHEDEIQRIYGRVQKAIEKKDATLEVLHGDNGILKQRCLKLEAIIRQQRKDYCEK